MAVELIGFSLTRRKNCFDIILESASQWLLADAEKKFPGAATFNFQLIHWREFSS